jgi:hypothetical protein
MTPKEVVDRIVKESIDKGQLIEAGWIALKLVSMPPNASQDQIDDMRGAFFAGAQHLFSSIMSVLEPDKEPTDNDLRRMAMIQSELQEFLRQFKLKHGLEER